MVNTPAPVKRKKKAVAINASGNRDIREMVGASRKKKTPKIIVIYDEQEAVSFKICVFSLSLL